MAYRTLIALGAAITLTVPAAAQDDDIGTPDVIQKLYDCRDIADPTQRLTCYDSQVAEIAVKEEAEDLVFADKGQIREARRGLFGLTLPRIRLFEGGDKEEFQEISSTITQASQFGLGRWAFVVEDGARWVQNESANSAVRIKAGMPVTIKRGSFGGYRATINNRRSIKVKRVQ